MQLEKDGRRQWREYALLALAFGLSRLLLYLLGLRFNFSLDWMWLSDPADLQHRLLHYRTELFKQLRDSLEKAGVELNLVHGQASPAEKIRRDEGELPWATVVKNSFWTVFGRDLIWQHLPSSVHAADLIVLMQENRILSNYPIQLRRARRSS